MFRPFKRPSSGHPLNDSSIKPKTYEMLAHYWVPCGFKPLDLIELSFNGWPDDGLLKGRNM
jgi:hypothetical protein